VGERGSSAGTLSGVRVAITRPAGQADSLEARLSEAGARVLHRPLIRIEPPLDGAPLARAAAAVGSYDWIVFSSANGVASFCRALDADGRGIRALDSIRVACVGPATAASLAAHGRQADLVPGSAFVAESLAESLASVLTASGDPAGLRILLPQAEAARPVLRQALQAMGARVDVVTAYRTTPDQTGAQQLRAELEAGSVDVIAFSSSSAVSSFVAVAGTAVGAARIAVIGPVTGSTARAAGLPVHAEAREYTAEGLAVAVLAAVAPTTPRSPRDEP
jgi:uroporphyrinogen III methyltransferase/synthase